MDQLSFSLLIIGLLVANFGTAGVLLALLERVPGLRGHDVSGSAATPSRSLGVVMLAGGLATFVLSALPGGRFVPGVLVGTGLSLLGASGFVPQERGARWLDWLGKLLMAAGFVLVQWLGSRT